MTSEGFKKWKALNQMQQVKAFKEARKVLGLNQTELGERLELYGYSGGKNTVQAWEQGRGKIPPLVYDLMVEQFRDR